MKKLSIFLMFTVLILFIACSNKDESERFKLLTTPVWQADSLLVDKQDASGPGQLLENFKGDAKFDKDGTGTFGNYTGQWRLNSAETEITIITDELVLPLICNIIELTDLSFKVTTLAPNSINPLEPYHVRMTFKAK